MGQPVAGNPTQYMMEKAFAAAGLDWRYLTLEVSPQNLPAALAGLRAMGFRGGNLTIPHKVAAIAHLDELSEAARLMGAVNCIHHVDGKLRGENTDGKGFVQSLGELTSPAGRRIEILGAGGAARAIAFELSLAKAASIDIVNRTPQRAEELVAALGQASLAQPVTVRYRPWEGLHRVAPESEIVINATSIGLGDSSAMVPLDTTTLLPNMIVADVIFNPSMTQLLRAAEERGCRTLDGLGMLVNQAVISFEIWTGVRPDAQVMRDALEEFLGF
jgi:shikimate dehydrogenase